MCGEGHTHTENCRAQHAPKHPTALFWSTILGGTGNRKFTLPIQGLGLTLWKNASD